MASKLTIVTKNLEVILTSDNYEEAIAFYKEQSSEGLYNVYVLDNPDRWKRIRQNLETQQIKPKRTRNVNLV